MAHTKAKGSIGEIMVAAEATKRGYKVALPIGEDWRYDLIVLRSGHLERVQCKYVKSDGVTIAVRCTSSNNWNVIKYTDKDIDWIAVYDETTNKCYFISSKFIGSGRARINLRLKATKNNQSKKIIWAKDFLEW